MAQCDINFTPDCYKCCFHFDYDLSVLVGLIKTSKHNVSGERRNEIY